MKKIVRRCFPFAFVFAAILMGCVTNAPSHDSSSCSEASSIASNYQLTAPDFFAVKTNETSFDFTKGVYLRHNGKKIRYSIDTSAVDFTQVGQYVSVIKTADESFHQTVPVRVYAKPSIRGNLENPSFEYAKRYDITKNFSCVDSFGEPLTIQAEYEADSMGRIASTGVTVHLTSVDAAGNVASFYAHDVRLTNMVTPKIADLTLDLASPENEIPEAKNYTNPRVACENHILNDHEWLLGSKISKRYLKSLGTGSHEFVFSCLEGYSSFVVTITDQKKPAIIYDLSYDGAEVLEGTLSLSPFALQSEDSYQNLEITYALTRNGEATDVREALPTGKYVYSALIRRGGETIETKSISFAVLALCDYHSSVSHLFASDYFDDSEVTSSFTNNGIEISAEAGKNLYFDRILLRSAIEQGRDTLCFRFQSHTASAGELLWFGNGAWSLPGNMVALGGSKETTLAGQVFSLSVPLSLFCDDYPRFNLFFSQATSLTLTEIKFVASPIHAVDSFYRAYYYPEKGGSYTLFPVGNGDLTGYAVYALSRALFQDGIAVNAKNATITFTSNSAISLRLVLPDGTSQSYTASPSEGVSVTVDLSLFSATDASMTLTFDAVWADVTMSVPLYA